MMMTSKLDLISIYTDGACDNGGGTRAHHGGWASILVENGQERIFTGHAYPETNSTAELKALIMGLSKITKPCYVEFYSDAQYLVYGYNTWLAAWKARNWKRVLNPELWKQIDRFPYSLHGNWIRGHAKKGEQSDHQKYNVQCDELAVEEAWKSYREHTGEKA